MPGPIVIPAVSDIGATVQMIDAYVHTSAAAALPAKSLAAAQKYYPSPVDKIVRSAEALYACAADLDSSGMTLVAQLAQFATANQWHNLGKTSRGLGIALAMRRRLGDSTVTQTADQDPVPDPSYLTVVPAPPTEETVSPTSSGTAESSPATVTSGGVAH